MTPFIFGSGPRRLYGVYSPPYAAGTRQRAAVLCYPWGHEYLRAHRSMRQLDRQLGSAGFHVLRFDYYGTGDSAGDMTDASLEGWEADIATAIDELKDTSAVTRVSLVGLRIGAALAANVAARRARDVDALVLWDPVVSGADYIAELNQSDRARGRFRSPPSRGSAAGGGREMLGFPLTDQFEADIRAIDLPARLAAVRARTAVIVSQPIPSHAALRSVFEGQDARSRTFERVEGEAAWISDPLFGAGAVPVNLLQRIVSWLA